MAQILIRNLPEPTVRRLKERARSSGRSLSADARCILEREAANVDLDQAPKVTMAEARTNADRIAAKIAIRGPQKTNSTDLVREDRER